MNILKIYTIEQLILYLAGVIIMPLGVVLTINAHLGAGGYDALNFALGDILGINTSLAIYATALLVVFITSFIRRGSPRFTTFISSFFLGLATDFWKVICAGIQGTNFISSILILLSGILLVGFGVASYMLSGLPTNPTDDMIAACNERGISIRRAKITLDVVCVVLALILGGEIGIGTIICTLVLGPIVDMFHHLLNNNILIKISK